MLSEFQKRKITLAFYKFDTSKDGVVKLEDWDLLGKKVAELQGIKPGEANYQKITSAYRGAWDAFFKPADQDSDNKVTLEEYLNACDRLFQTPNAAETSMVSDRAVFDAIDLDGTGKIDVHEYAIYLKSLGLSEEDAKVAFSKLDLDSDGFISRDEFALNLFAYYQSDDPQAVANWFYGSY